MSINASEIQRQAVRERLYYLLIIALGAFVFLIARFYILQIVQYRDWRDFAEIQQIRPSRISPIRGDIFDRHKSKLAGTEPSYNVMVIPQDVTDDAIARLAELLGTTPEILREREKKNRSWWPFKPALVAENIDRQAQLPAVRVNRPVLPGVEIEERPVRKYGPEAVLVAHLMGYLGEIGPEELKDPDNSDYLMGDRIGKSGLEKGLESELRGQYGTEYKLQDARGREITAESAPRDLRAKSEYLKKIEEVKAMAKPMVPGHSVVLTLDLEVVRSAKSRLGDQRGSVVVLKVDTGELLCLLSNPSYDPALFANGISPEQWQALLEDPNKPLFNRALVGRYRPASVFKIVVAAAALEEKKITLDQKFTCNGFFELGQTTKTRYGCWNKFGHGPLDLEHAIMESCDVYFYNLGATEISPDLIAKWARKFGLGQRLLGGIISEEDGLVPDPAWKKKELGRNWVRGETVLMAIGEGYTLVTPLQEAMIASAVAGGGRLMQPQVVHHFETVDGRIIEDFSPRVLSDRMFSPATLGLLRRGMWDVINDPRGTAYKYAHSNLVTIAGKTGTAEVSKKYKGRACEDIPYDHRDNAWFVGFAPAEAPEIAVAVMIEHGCAGSQAGGPVAKGIIEDYFSRPPIPSDGDPGPN
jgi:penicillin-binding protein 2